MVSTSDLPPQTLTVWTFYLSHYKMQAGMKTYSAYHFRYFTGKEKSDPRHNLLSDIGSFILLSVIIFLIYNMKKRD